VLVFGGGSIRYGVVLNLLAVGVSSEKFLIKEPTLNLRKLLPALGVAVLRPQTDAVLDLCNLHTADRSVDIAFDCAGALSCIKDGMYYGLGRERISSVPFNEATKSRREKRKKFYLARRSLFVMGQKESSIKPQFFNSLFDPSTPVSSQNVCVRHGGIFVNMAGQAPGVSLCAA
jgi:hypothetical protein